MALASTWMQIKPSLYVLKRRNHLLYSHLQHHNDTINKQTHEDFFNNILPLTLLQGFEKGYSKFACERELETEQKLQYFDLNLMAGNVVSFSFSSGPQLNQGSREPLRPGVAFLTTSRLQLRPIFNSTPVTSVLTELYNSSTSTRSLKSHV